MTVQVGDLAAGDARGAHFGPARGGVGAWGVRVVLGRLSQRLQLRAGLGAAAIGIAILATACFPAGPQPPPGFAAILPGIYQVGVNVVPFTYRTQQAAPGGCYWARLDAGEGIIANDFTTNTTIVTIMPTDAFFQSDSCPYFTASRAPITSSPVAPFFDGQYFVGTDIATGTWVTSGGPGCYWERESGFGGSFSDIIANNFGPGVQAVDILPGDVGFKSDGCAGWVRISATATAAGAPTHKVPPPPVHIPPNLPHLHH